MSNIDIIRAWKNEDYRNSLSEEQRSQLPENPAGVIELPEEKTEMIKGGGTVDHISNGVTCGGKFSNGVTCAIARKIFRQRN